MGGSYPAQNLKRNTNHRISISLLDVGNKAPSGVFNETSRTPKRQKQLKDILTWEKQRSVRNQLFKVKSPLFLLGQEGKTEILRGYYGVQKFNKAIMPRVIPKAEEASTILRSPYTRTVKSERQAIATLKARYQMGATL